MTNKWFEEIEDQHWLIGSKNDNTQISFLPILPFGSGSLQLAMSRDGEWLIQINRDLFSMESIGPAFVFLSLLELSYPDFKKEVFHSIENVGGNPDSAWKTLPVHLIILSGLKQPSNYWADLALHWIPFLSQEERMMLKDELSIVYSAKWASQYVRHQAFKWLKRLDNPKGPERSVREPDKSNE